MHTKTVLLLTAFVASAVAGPLSSRGSCSRHCTESSKLKYEPGTTYTYDYSADTTTTMMGTMDEESKLYIKASVLMTAHSKCDMSMQLRDVSLEEYDPKFTTTRKASINTERFSKDLQQNSVRFSFQDGKIEEICPSKDESSWVLNVKRGILTIFQNSMSDLDKDETLEEVDVAGKCPVTYEYLGTSWGTISVKKSKDFVQCTDRQSADTSIQSTSYNHNSGIKSNPLIKGRQECKQSFSYHKLQKSICEENLIFRPFSNKKSGAVTKASQTLTFNKEEKSSFAGDDYESIRSKLIFNHEIEENNAKRKYKDAEQTLIELCKSSADDIRKEVPHLFSQYVYTLKHLKHSHLEAIYARSTEICKYNRKAEKYFTDALPSVGTEASVRLMIELIRNKKVSEAEADYWYTTFAFMSKPSVEMLNHLASALNEPKQQAILGISSMVNTYCMMEPDCQHQTAVQRIITKLSDMLNNDCKASNEEESRQVLLALKGIGNAGHSIRVADILNKCAKNTKTSNDIRIAAIEAFRRQPCIASRRSLMNLFRDLQEATEVRIAAYLALMKCPDANIIQNVKDVLNIEEVNQVGSFVWTHLTNMQETTDPCKEDIKNILRNVFLEKKFSADVRKFSRAFEKSLFSEKFNGGVHVDSNIIFTPKSYLPRSAMFNLTMDLFGQSLNLFEIGGKVEGFEHLVESFFGPNGFFPDKNVKEFLKNSRTKRSVYDNKIQEFEKLYKEQSKHFEKPEGSMYFKMFGNELMYEDFKGLESLLSYTEQQINWVKILEDLARNRDIEYTKSVMFLDATYTVPTSVGFPLHLSVNGTSTINLKLGGKLDLRNILRKEIDINGHIKPSGAVEISAVMAVDAFYAQTGLKMVATMHSSTNLDGKIQMKNGKVLKTILNIPNDKIEILDIETNVFVVNQDIEYPQKGIDTERTEVHECTGKTISKITGMKLCGELQFPNASLKYDAPYFPLTGPAKFSIYLKKTDMKMMSYKFDATYENSDDKKAALLSFDTPGSKVDREMTVEMSMDKIDHKVALRLRTPMKKMGLSGELINKENEKKAEFIFTVDDIEKLAMISALNIQKTVDSVRYTPNIEVRIPGKKPVKLSGYGFLQPERRFIVDINVDNLAEKTIKFKVDVNKQSKDRYAVDSRIVSHLLSARIRGNVQRSERGTNANMNIDYSFLQGKYERIKIGTKFQDLSASSLRKIKIGISLDMSAAPDYITQLNWETQVAKGHIENTLKVSQGIKGKNKIDIFVQEIVSYSFLPGKNSIYTNFKVKIPVKKINYVWYLKHQNTASYVKSRAFVQYASRRRVDCQIQAVSVKDKVYGEVKLIYPGREMKLTGKLDKGKKNQYDAAITAQWQKGKKITANIEYINKSGAKELFHTLEVDFGLLEKVVKYNGEIKANKKICMIKNRLSYGEDVYMLNSDYLRSQRKFTSVLFWKGKSYHTEAYVLQEETFSEASLDIKLDDYRRIKSLASFNSQDKSQDNNMVGKVNLLWNADKDTSERFELYFKYDPADDSTYASLYYPDRTLTAAIKPKFHINEKYINAQLSTDFSWERNKKISLNMNLVLTDNGRQITTTIEGQTPCDGYKEISLKHFHQFGKENLVSKTTGTLNKNDYINLEFNGHFQDGPTTVLKSDVKFTSTIEDYEAFGADLEHTFSSSQFITNATLSWGSYKEISFSMNGLDSSKYDIAKMQGQFYFTSPFDSYNLLSGSINHYAASNEIRTTGNFKWSPNEEISVNFGGSGTKIRNKQICKAIVRISTPFSAYENIASDVQYENNGIEMSTKGGISWAYKKITFGCDGSYAKSSEDNKNIEGSLYLTTPYEVFKSFKASGKHEFKKISVKNMYEIQVNDGKYTLKTFGKRISKDTVQNGIEIFTPIKHFNSFKTDFTYWMSEKDGRWHLEVILNEKKTTVDVKTDYKSGVQETFNWELICNSPLTEDKALVISGQHKKKTGNIINVLKYKLGLKEAVFDHSLDYTDMLNFNNTMQFSHTWGNEYPQLILENKQIVKEKYVTSKHTITVDNYKFWEIQGEYTVEKSKAKANLNVEDHNGKIFSVTGTHVFEDKSYNPSLDLAWRANSETERLGLGASWNWYEAAKRDGEIRLSSSFKGYETLIAKIEHDLEHQTKNARVDFSKNDKTLSLTGKIDTNKKSGIFTFNSPFENYEELILQGNYDYDDKLDGKISLQWTPSKKMEMTANLVKSDEKAATNIEFKSPFESYENLIFFAKYDVSKKKKYAEMSLEYAPNKVIILKTHVKIQKEQGNGKITFTSPVEGFSSLLLQANYDVSKTLKTANVNFECPSQHKWSVDGKVSNSDDIKFAKLTVKTPYEKMNSLVLSANLDTSNSLKTVNIKSIWNMESTIELNGNFEKESKRSIKGEISFTSPFEDFENIKYDINLENYGKTYQGSSSFSWKMDKKMTTDVTIKLEPLDIAIRADTPFDPVKNVYVRSNFVKINDLEFAFVSSLEWKNVNKIQLAFQNQVAKDNELRTEFILTTSYENFDQLKFQSSLLKTKKIIAAGFSAKTPFKTLPSLEVSFTFTNSNNVDIVAKFQIDTDKTVFKATANKNKDEMKFFLSAPQVIDKPLTVDITFDSRDMNVINFSNGHNLYTVKYSLILEADKKKLSTELRIPTLNYNNRIMNLDLSFINRQNQVIDVSAQFRNLEDTHKISATFNQGYKLLKGNLILSCPLLKVKSITLTGDVQYGNEKKINVYFKTLSTTYSIVGVLGDHTPNKVNGFISLNTPADVLGTIRLDINFVKNEWTNTEGFIKVETSNENFRSASIQGKFIKYDDRMESTITAKTPFKNYEKVTVAGKLTHDEKWKSIKPTITLSLAGSEMNAFIEYEDTYDHNKAVLRFTKDRKLAYEVLAQIKKREYSIILSATQTSGYDVKSYRTQMKFKNHNGQHTFDASLNLPDNERAAINGAINYNDWKNFNGRVSFTSTFDNYESLSATVHQSIGWKKTDLQLRTSWSPSKIVKFEIKTTENESGGNRKFEMLTPWKHLQDVSATYEYSQKISQKTHELEIKYLRNIVAHVTTTFNEGKDQTTIAAEFPSLSMKSSGMFKSGKQSEITFKVDIPSRIVFFHTLFAPTSRGFKHSTEIAWNKRQSKQASYEVIYADRSKRGISTGDLTIRLIHQIRAFELTFSHECTSKDVSASTKFMWDSLRNTRKQITVAVDVHDKSVYGKNSYDGAIILKTPQLSKDVKLLGLVEFSKLNKEMFKTNWKLDYSENRRKALLFELKLTDDTKGRSRGEGIMYSLRSRLIQPQSVIYFNTYSSINLTPTVKKIDSRFTYVDSASVKKSYLLRSVLNKQKLTMQISSPSKSVKMIGNAQTNSADFDVTVNKEKILFAQCRYDLKKTLSVNADVIYYPTNDGFKFQVVNGNSISVELNHKSKGHDFSDFLFTLGLRNPRILSSNIEWRTTVLSELKNEIISIYTVEKDAMKIQLKQLKEKIESEFKHKMSAVQRVNAVELKPLIESWKVMKNDLYYDYVVLKKQATNMYENNEFYLQNIVSAAKSVCEKGGIIIKKIGEQLTSLKNCIEKMGKITTEFVYKTASSTKYYIKKFYSDFTSFLSNSYYAVLETIENLILEAIFFIQDSLNSIQVYLTDMGDKLLNKMVYFVNEYLPFVKTIEEYLEKLKDYQDSVMLKIYKSKMYKIAKRYFASISQIVEDVNAITVSKVMKSHYEKVSTKFSNLYTGMKDTANIYTKRISEHPHIAFVGEISNHGYQKVAWAYRYWAVDAAIDSIYQNWHKIIYTLTTDIAHDATSKYTAFIRDSKFIYKPDIGKIEMDLRIPSDRKSLKQIFDIYSSPEYKKLIALKEKYLPENRMTAWDYWYLYKPHSDVTNWMPPFKSQALIAGRQHYMTFDKLFYDFAGQCSYLLAHDMIDGNFTVIAKYEKDYNSVPKKTIVVKSDDRTIEITRTFKVLIDDEKIDLPYQFDNTMITRFDDVITLNNKNGLTVRCNFYRDVCTVDMSGWYFAKTGGLFGVYDNEPKLDLQKPDGEVTKSIDDFTHSWSVGSGQCTSGNYAAQKDSYDMEARKFCEEIFNSGYSSLRSCFKIVSTKQFMEMCLVDVTNRDRYDSSPMDEAICTSAYAYKQRCLAEEVEVKMPSSCGRCKGLNNKSMFEGESFTIDSNNKPNAVDIVFIVEEKECNKDKYGKLEEISQGIERSLRDQGIRKATYSVVGYGGDGVHEKPHVHWAESEQSGNYRSVANAFRSLTVGNGNSDVYDAVLFATNLKFTPGAARTFVLVKCSSCNGGRIKEYYSDMMWMLVNHGINLHVLMDNNFKLRSGSRKSSGILGMDKVEAFTTKDARDKMLKGDATLRDQIYDVKDLCIPLALETNGTMFNSYKLIDKKRSIQKNFIHVFSRRLVQTTKSPNCQLCFCHSQEESSGKVDCSACISPFTKAILTPNLPDISSWPELTSVINTKKW